MENVTLVVETDNPENIDLVAEWIDEMAKELAVRLDRLEMDCTVYASDSLSWSEQYK